jgi:hypothetical protein
MTDIYDPHNFEKVCVNTVLEVMRESAPLYGPRAYHLCHSKVHELPTSFRYLLILRQTASTLCEEPDESRLAWALIQTFLHSLLTPVTVLRLIEDDRATTDWLAEEVDILTRTIFGK